MARILGMGYAVMERTVRLPYPLGELGYAEGEDRHMDLGAMEGFIARTIDASWVESAGGSVVNTLRGLAGLGIGVGFIGKVGSDGAGEQFYNTLRGAGISPILRSSPARTGYRFNLVDSAGRCARTTFLAAAATLNSNDLNPKEFSGFDIFHLEGSSVANHALFMRALSIAQDAQVRVSFDMGTMRIIDAHREFLHKALPGRVDILLANEHEARAFTGHAAREALGALADICRIVVLKLGPEGAMAMADGEYVASPAPCVRQVDRSGAGDLFNAGLLHGVAAGWPVARALRLATAMGSSALAAVGPHLDPSQWEALRAMASSTAG